VFGYNDGTKVVWLGSEVGIRLSILSSVVLETREAKEDVMERPCPGYP
jgi:hypothetical protein